MGRRKPRDLCPPRINLNGRDRERRVIDDDFEGADLTGVTHCWLREQPITRLPAFGPALVELELALCKELVTLDGIERCTGLTKLSLSVLSEDMDLPSELARLAELPELTCLELHHIDALPANLADLPSLIELELHDCALDLAVIGKISTLRRLVLRGHEPWTLPAVAPLAGNVTELALQNVGTMPASLGALTRLERLKIERARHLRKFPSDLGTLASLVELSIDAPIRTLDDSICACTRLEVLELGSTSIAKLPANIGNLTRLRVLRLLGTKIDKVPESIGELAELRELSLPFDAEVPDSITQLAIEKFFGAALIGARIPRRPPSTPHEDDLRLVAGAPLPADFGDPRSLELAVPDDHGPVPQLASLRRLTRAWLRVPDVENALAALANSPRLEMLELKAIDTLPEAIGKLVELQELSLRCPALTRVPACVADLPALEALSLDLDGRTFPEAFARSRSLTRVTITCSEPATNLLGLAKLARLDSLTLEGPIPDLEGLLRALAATPITQLAIGRRAGRALPETIGALARTLTRIELHRSDITRLPRSLRDCTALTWVSLPAPELGLDAVQHLPPIKWTKRKWATEIRFERSKRQ